MSKYVLFIDDDPLVLMAFERLLHPFRPQWEMEFTSDGSAALRILQQRPIDVVVTDVKMPGVSGVELLEEVRRQYPRIMRVAVSGQSDRESMLRSAIVAHYYLTKPCEPGTLAGTLQRALALQEKIGNARLDQILGRSDRLPSAPSLYNQLVEAMRSPACNIAMVSRIIEQDMAIASRLLQLANSPLFGFRYQVSNPSHAVSLLGVNAVKSLVLSLGIFSQFSSDQKGGAEISLLFEHSILASQTARHIGELVGLDRHALDDCFTAGLLHDIGKLILITQLPAEWERIHQAVKDEHIGLSEAERRILSCSHDEIGAHLLELWCLPSAIVEAVAWRLHPSDSPVQTPGPLPILHLADALCLNPSSNESFALDKQFLLGCGIDPGDETFMTKCQSLAPQGATQ